MRYVKREPDALRCYKCFRIGLPGNNLRIGNDIVMRKRARRGDDGPAKKHEHVAIDCRSCGNQWYSSHPDALAAARQSDRNINRRHGIRPKAKAS